ncbi:MAG: MBL fold metallo-hydrolase [Balneolales bacterium]|nr:MBL fold metallo-hydrolase [Balneolales bacterium]
MIVETFEVNPFSQNTYLLIEDGQAILIDAGFSVPSELNKMTDTLKQHHAILKAVILTHAHIDHVMGLQRVLEKYDVPVWLCHKDLYLWQNFHVQGNFYGLNAKAFDFIPNELVPGEMFMVGRFTMEVLFTPGHSPDHVSLYFKDENKVFAGDVLFNGSIGRTDLYKGNYDILEKSVREKLYTLPDETEVFPGHGPSTLIGHEKKFNAFIKQ